MPALSLAAIVWLILASIWGSTWLFIKLGLDDQIPPFTLMAARFAIAWVVLGLVALTRTRHLPRDKNQWFLIIFTGNLMFGINYSLVYWGESYISSGLAAVVYTTLPLIGAVIAHFMLPDEPLTMGKVMGVGFGLAGVGVIFADQMAVSGVQALWGAAAIVMAVLCTAFAATFVKLYLRQIDPVMLTLGQISASLPLMFGLVFLFEGSPLKHHWTPLSLLGVTYLGIIGSALTFGLLNWLFRHMDVTKTQLIPLGSTLIAVFLGWAVRGETLGWRTASGGSLIILGLYTATRANRKLLAAKA